VLSVSVGTILRYNMLLGQAFDHLTKRAIPAIGASTDAPLCP